MGTSTLTPIERLTMAWNRFVNGTPAEEAGKCEYCRAPSPPHAGIRMNGRVYCDDECLSLAIEQAA